MENNFLIVGIILLIASVIASVMVTMEKTGIEETKLLTIAIVAFIIGSIIGTGIAWRELTKGF